MFCTSPQNHTYSRITFRRPVLSSNYFGICYNCAYGETSCWTTLSDDGVRLAWLNQFAGSLFSRGRRHAAEVPESDVDSLSSACIDDPRALSRTPPGAVWHRAADVSAPWCHTEWGRRQTRSALTQQHCTGCANKNNPLEKVLHFSNVSLIWVFTQHILQILVKQLIWCNR